MRLEIFDCVNLFIVLLFCFAFVFLVCFVLLLPLLLVCIYQTVYTKRAHHITLENIIKMSEQHHNIAKTLLQRCVTSIQLPSSK